MRADLHRLVVPEDRVRADAALAVVDDRALVVRPQEDELPVELEKVALVEALDLAVGNALAVADHAAKAPLGRKHLGHAGNVSASAFDLDEHGDRVPLGLEHRLGHVAEVLAVGLERQRLVAADDAAGRRRAA